MIGDRPATASIESRQDFIVFVRNLRRSLGEEKEGIENSSVDAYLEAMAAWTEDMDGLYLHRGDPVPTEPTWRMLAEIVAAALVYE